MLSNLVKAGAVRKEDTRVIDYNDLVLEKMETYRALMKYATRDEENGMAEGGVFIQGIVAEQISVTEETPDIEAEFEKAREDANEFLAQAQAQADELLRQANAESELIKERAFEEGKNAGYIEGMQKAASEMEKKKAAFEEECSQTREEYRRQFSQMEPELVNVILEVVSKAVGVLSVDKKGIIGKLVDDAFNHMESSREYIVRLSARDYEVLLPFKEELMKRVPGSSSIELVRDATLGKNECLIETDGGIFDCSLDTQLQNLIQDLKVLSIS